MARIPLTPPINAEGLFKVNAPFVIPENVIFHVDAVRTFPDIVRKDRIDPFATYYAPVGLTDSVYAEDATAGASIVTLKSKDGQILDIPNTYIQSYPGANGVAYVRNVLILDLALVPDYVDVSVVKDDVSDVVRRLVGVDTGAEITTLAYEGVVTDANHLQMEAVRKSVIREAIPLSEQVTTLTARNAELQALVDQLQTVLAAVQEQANP